jgi:hypothetical protein
MVVACLQLNLGVRLTKHMRTLNKLLAIVILGCVSEKAAPADPGVEVAPKSAVPVFEVDIWPGEGIPVVQAVRGDLPLREAPDFAAAIVGTLRAKAGERIRYDSTRFQTVSPAVVRIVGAGAVRGRSLGTLQHLSRSQYYSNSFRDTTIQLDPSIAMEYLQYRAEGTCFLRIGIQVVDASPCPTLDTSKFALKGEPVTRWWIRALGSTASGWLLISDSTATVIDRTF